MKSDEIIINTQEGPLRVTKSWIKTQVTNKNNKWSFQSNTCYITNNGHTWSINNKDLDSIIIEIRDDKINLLLSDSIR